MEEAAAEAREADIQMEEANAIKLALMLAKEKGCPEVNTKELTKDF